VNTSKRENSINNSWQIHSEFAQRDESYHTPGRAVNFTSTHGRSGKVKTFSEEEILVYKLMQVREVESLQ